MSEWDRVEKAAKKAANQAKAAADKAREQAETNLKNLEEKAKKAADVAREQAKTNAEHLGERVERDADNFIRWLKEDDCDRIGRKEGPAAKARCKAKKANQRTVTVPPSGAGHYYAAMEVDCMRPDDEGIWGSSTIQYWSKVSKADARQNVEKVIDSYNGRVCATRWNDAELTDGPSRWVSE